MRVRPDKTVRVVVPDTVLDEFDGQKRNSEALCYCPKSCALTSEVLCTL